MKVFNAFVNSTNTDDGLDRSESTELPMLASAGRWINRRAGCYLGASIYEVDREIAGYDDLGPYEKDTEVSTRIYTRDEHGRRFVLDEIIDETGVR